MAYVWTNKYLPKSTQGIKGQERGVFALKLFVRNFKTQKHRAVLIYGPTGCGKSAAVTALAKELSLELVELNASDFRNKDAIERIIGAASRQMSLFAKGKLILIDEVDGLAGREDRGGLATLIRLLKETAFPIVLTANEPFEKKFSALRKVVQLIEFEKLEYKVVMDVLKAICEKEGVGFEPEALEGLSRRADGDLRAAIIDLFLLTRLNRSLTRKTMENLDARKRELSITEGLKRIFKTKNVEVALSALNDVNMDEALLWIDENLPKEYTKAEELDKAYDCISKADVFRGRIRRWQYWRFLVYVNAMLTAGIAIAKQSKYAKIVNYERSKRILKIWIYNRKNLLRKSIAEKLGKVVHSSSRRAFKQSVPFVKHMFQNSKEFAAKFTAELELDEKEIEWLKMV